MKGVAHMLLLTLAVLTLFSRGLALDVFLKNITIHTDHEPNPPFITNHPEVYLSCNDGRPILELKHVNDENRVYEFSSGEVLATTVNEGGDCVDCRLRESDGSILADDTFGDFSLCRDQFTQTGDHIVSVPGQFTMGFQCPDCLVNPEPEPEPVPEPEELPPAPEPDADLEEIFQRQIIAAPPSIEAVEEESDEDSIGQYYYFTTSGTTFSVENSDEEVGLQSEDEDERKVETGSTDGLSTGTVLSLCFVFLIVGVGIGVLIFRKYSTKIANERAAASAFEMTKLGVMKKGKI